MAFTDIMAQLNTDLDTAYDESGEEWILNKDRAGETKFTGLSRSSRNDENVETMTSERTTQERELRWRASEMGDTQERDRFYFVYEDSYWMAIDKPELIEGEYIVQLQQVKISTRGAAR